MSLLQPAVHAPHAAERRPRRDAGRAGWLVLGCYLGAAFAVTSRLWADPAARIQAAGSFTDSPDITQFAWFLRNEATALSHGRLPALTTTAMNAPHGISMLWNTSLLLPGIVLSPVTLLAGPQVTLTLLLTLGFAGSAASLFWVLRRWGASLGAAALGGVVYGFSPALLDAGLGHYNLQFAVFPPLIIDALMRLVTGRGRPGWTGAWLGALIAAQLLTGEELLVDTALAAIVLVVVAAAGCTRAVLARAVLARAVLARAVLARVRGTALGLATAAAVTLAICGRALWVQFRGPLRQHGSPWMMSEFYAHPADLVTAPGTLLFHTSASAAAAASYYQTTLAEYVGYLGLPLLVLLVAAAGVYWRDPKIRAAAVTCAMLELCTLGCHYGYLPWHYLQNLPLLGQIIPERLAILADGAAAAVLAFSLDRVRAAAPRPAVKGRSGDPRGGWRAARASLATGAAALAVLPLIPLPYQAASVPPVPAGWRTAFARLRLAASAPVLVIPVPLQDNDDAMRWQADSGDPGSLIGGYFIGPSRSGLAQEYGTFAVNAAHSLDAIWAGDLAAYPSALWIRATIEAWRPAAVVAVATPGSGTGRTLTGILGPATFRVGKILAWRR
jgi:hypothetical protein